MTGRSGGAGKIGGVFLRAAAGPLSFAASCISGNKIQKGLEELEPSGLADAFDRGVGEVAKLVGVPKAEVDRVLPLEEVAAVQERLRHSHGLAIEAWRLHAGQFGFFDAVTALTVDGRPVEIGLCLALFWIRLFGITGGYHRYFSHRAYKTSRAFQLVLAVLGCAATQKGPLWWAAHHRRHGAIQSRGQPVGVARDRQVLVIDQHPFAG